MSELKLNTDNFTPLMLAKDINQIKKLLKEGADPNVMVNNSTALSVHNNMKIVKLLIPITSLGNRNSALNVVDTVSKFNYLIETGSDINNLDYIGGTPLHYNICPKIVKLMLNLGADPNIRNSLGETPIFYHFIAENVKLLIEAGADLTIRSNFINTHLLFNANLEKMKLLIEAGIDLNTTDKNGSTALMKCKEECTQLLLDSGADYNMKDIKGRTMLHYSRWCPDIDVDQISIDGISALGTILSNSYKLDIFNYKFIKKLLNAGADPNVYVNENVVINGCTIITISKFIPLINSQEDPKIIKLLIKAGAELKDFEDLEEYQIERLCKIYYEFYITYLK